MAFQDEILIWYHLNARNLPWRNTKDPYKIWLSEIILQQTRVEQGLPYYHRFITSFPTLKKLATASEEKILKLWQGLGYYSRGRNLLVAAREMMERHNGFPETYEEIRNLKGIGDYTAAAVASFAFNLPHAVVDGNVYRFFSRLHGISTPVDSARGKKEFKELAAALLNRDNPAEHNQAVMEMGAMVCKPKPHCDQCPFAAQCIARKENAIDFYPVKEKRTAVKQRFFYYLLLHAGKKIFIQKRTGKDIWEGLYEFPLIECSGYTEPEDLYRMKEWKTAVAEAEAEIYHVSKPYTHKLSHQVLHARFIHLQIKKVKRSLPDTWKSVPADHLEKYGMPQLIVKYLKDQEQDH
jgi:A/G-specific adenine glycosylase